MRKNEAAWVDSRKRWQINVQSDGERKTFSSSTRGKKGKIEAERKADRWMEEHLTDENTRVEKMLDKWYEKLKISTSYSNYHQYDGYIRNYIKPVIGTKRIGRLTKNDLQSVIDNAYNSKKLSEKTLHNIRGCLMAFMSYCRDSNATNLYTGKLTVPASARKSSKQVLSPNALSKLFSSSTTTMRGKPIEDFFVHAYRFAVLTGLRPGELLGLMNSNICENKITITQAINDIGEITQGKNDNARRTYKIGELALRELQEQKAMLKKSGKISKYIFPCQSMDYTSQQLFRKSWKRYCAANGITDALTPYELRHTFVSVNVEMPEKLKKMVIGHSKAMDTEGHYGHEMQGDMELAADYVDKAFGQYIS